MPFRVMWKPFYLETTANTGTLIRPIFGWVVCTRTSLFKIPVGKTGGFVNPPMSRLVAKMEVYRIHKKNALIFLLWQLK